MTDRKSLSLFEIGETLEALLAAIDDAEEHEERERLLTAYLATEGAMTEKVDGYAYLIRSLDARAKARTEEANRLAGLAQSDMMKAAHLKGTLQSFMDASELTRIETKHFRVIIQGNGGSIPVVVDTDPEDLPRQYVRITLTPDREAIREALQEGKTIPGCSLGERGKSLRIK